MIVIANRRCTFGVVLACAVALLASGCGVFSNTADHDAPAMLRDFAVAMRAHDTTRAANLTTAPSQAQEVLDRAMAGMAPTAIEMSVINPVSFSDGTASFTLHTVWKLARDGSWTSQTSGRARKLSVGWRIQWDPSIIATGLTQEGTLRTVRTDAKPAPRVIGADKSSVLVAQPVNSIVVNPTTAKSTTASALAAAIEPVAPLVTTATIKRRLAGAKGKPTTVVSLRDSDMGALLSDPDRIAGVAVVKTTSLLTVDRSIQSPLFGPLTDIWQAIRDTTSGYRVEIAPRRGKPIVLQQNQGPPGPNIDTTLLTSALSRASNAVAVVGQPATLAVINTNTAGIVAAAQNNYAKDSPLTAPHTHGNTLEPVVDAINRVTTDPKQQWQLLDRLGLDIGFAVPGLGSATEQQRDRSVPISSGTLQVSVIQMAAFAVAMDKGTSLTPYVMDNQRGAISGGQLGAVDPAVLRDVRASMARTARSGDASDITGAPGLRALVGTNGPQGPGWFVGISGNQAVVIYCEGDKSGSAALAVAQAYFTPPPTAAE